MMRRFAMMGALALPFTPVGAQETTTYSYDELGRLIETEVTGGPNDAVDTELNYDDAGNRTSYTVTGSSVPPADLRIIPVAGGKIVVVIY